MPLPAPYAAVEELLLEQVRASKRGHLLGALVLAGLCAACALAGHLGPSEASARRIDGLAGLGVLAAIGLAIPGLGDPRRHRALHALRTRTGAVVWAYLALHSGQASSASLVLGMDDGSRLWLFCKNGKGDEVLAAVASVVPSATLGFSAEHEVRFLAAPPSLRGS